MSVQIYGTLGPSCADAATLARMIGAGMTGIRLNLSHTTLREAKPYLDAVHAAERETGRSIGLLLDMQGPELRVGRLREPMALEEGAHVALGEDGIPLPGVEISLPAMTAQDRENLALAPSCGVTAVMQPFVRSADDLKAVRAAMNKCGGTDIRLFAKIENRRGMDALAELLPHADEIVIARGDLGNAVPLWELPAVQKRIAARCRENGTPFMVVTQMLASMEHSRVPTRAEMSDVFNAVLDGAASVMVTGETAAGEYPADVIRYLALAAHAAETFLKEK